MDHKDKDDQIQLSAMINVIDLMSQTLKEHPGFMWTPSGFEVLHADWPAYPSGNGVRAVLAILTDFPDDVNLFRIDWIDACSLFVVGAVKGDKFSKDHFHVAIWDDDIRELVTSGYVSGVSVSGQKGLEFHTGGMSLTDGGRHAGLYFQLSKGLRPEILNKAEDLVLERRYDTAVRESALLLEGHLRELTGSMEFGQALVDGCFGTKGGLLPRTLSNAARLELRSSFRRYFRYMRNEFAHNSKTLSLLTTCRLLTWCSDLYAAADACKSSTKEP